MIKRAYFVLIIPAVFILDRVFKILIIRNYFEGEGFPVIRGFFHITRVNNTGAAFGLLKGYSGALVLISIICVIFLASYLFRNFFSKSNKLAASADPLRGFNQIAWSLVIGGALGNLYDRIRYGYVIDFLDFRVWPVFNIADTSICIGIFLVAAVFLWRGRAQRAE